MNWIDELKKQQEEMPFSEASVEQEENFDDAMRAMLAEKLFAQPKSREEKLKDNRQSCLSIAEDISDLAAIFYDKLRGKFSTEEITNMITETIAMIGGI